MAGKDKNNEKSKGKDIVKDKDKYEDDEDLIVLIDEDGNEIAYEHLDTIEMNGNEYVVLMQNEEDESGSEDNTDTDADADIDIAANIGTNKETDEESDEGEIVILKIAHNNNGEDTFVSIDNEKELDEVFEEFRRRMEEEYDFEA